MAGSASSVLFGRRHQRARSPRRSRRAADLSRAGRSPRPRAHGTPPPGLGVTAGDDVTHVHTRITVAGKPAVISDYYEPLDLTRGTPLEDPEAGPTPHSPIDRFPTIGHPVDALEETLSFRSPPPDHAEFLDTPPSGLAVTIRQQFWSGDRVVQMADITYPFDRYAGFAFRMRLPEREDTPQG